MSRIGGRITSAFASSSSSVRRSETLVVLAGAKLAFSSGIAIWIVGLFTLAIWAIYRIVRGWTRLNRRQPVP
jgi:uncharacterized membrane protein